MYDGDGDGDDDVDDQCYDDQDKTIVELEVRRTSSREKRGKSLKCFSCEGESEEK